MKNMQMVSIKNKPAQTKSQLQQELLLQAELDLLSMGITQRHQLAQRLLMQVENLFQVQAQRSSQQMAHFMHNGVELLMKSLTTCKVEQMQAEIQLHILQAEAVKKKM